MNLNFYHYRFENYIKFCLTGSDSEDVVSKNIIIVQITIIISFYLYKILTRAKNMLFIRRKLSRKCIDYNICSCFYTLIFEFPDIDLTSISSSTSTSFRIYIGYFLFIINHHRKY